MPKPTGKTAHMSVHIPCTQYSYSRTVLIIFPLILQTIVIAQIIVFWREGRSFQSYSNIQYNCDQPS